MRWNYFAIKRIAFTLAATALLLSSNARAAGVTSYPEVFIDPVNHIAEGSLVGARTSADSNQRLGCRVQVLKSGKPPYAVCFATNAAGRTMTCYSEEPAYVRAAAALSSHGFLRFSGQINPVNGVLMCTSVTTGASSKYLP